MPYVFDPEVLRECVQEGVGLPIEENVETVISALQQRYGQDITPDGEWVFSNAGGIMGTVKLLYDAHADPPHRDFFHAADHDRVRFCEAGRKRASLRGLAMGAGQTRQLRASRGCCR